MKVLPIRSERRSDIPAVTHVDGTGRLQTVEKDQNAMFYGLIEKFGRFNRRSDVIEYLFQSKRADCLQCR